MKHNGRLIGKERGEREREKGKGGGGKIQGGREEKRIRRGELKHNGKLIGKERGEREREREKREREGGRGKEFEGEN